MRKKHFAVAAAVLFGIVTLTVTPPRLFVINFTASLPRGLYYVSSRPPRAGDFVIIDSGRLAFNNGLRGTTLLKRIAFDSGERVSLTADALTVNDEITIGKWRPVGVTGDRVLRAGECVILGDAERSFDSRYFGPVLTADCTRVAPLFLIDRAGAHGGQRD